MSFADAMRRVIIGSLRGEPSNAPKDLGCLLELLHELLVADGKQLDDTQARAYLQSIKTGGKAAKLIAKLLPQMQDTTN